MSRVPGLLSVGEKAVAVARREGPRVVLGRGLRKLADRVQADPTSLPLFLEDVVTGPRSIAPVEPSPARHDGSLVISWVMTPPGPGSGGHTTALRMVEGLERQGHRCRLHLYDRYQGDLRRHEQVLRAWWPRVQAEVVDGTGPLAGCDAAVATSWETAHVVARRPSGTRFYFVQDYEPDFYPMGTERQLARATYDFGFHGITAGPWLAERLAQEHAMHCDAFEFGCDTDVYRLQETGPRRGVVFYAKPDVPRRAFWLGVLALQQLHRLRPDVEIHTFGHSVPRLPFPYTDHGRLTPLQLNELYNRCAAGLSLSLTNVSLIPWELLASGCTPVVNDAPHNRAVLRSAQVAWSGDTADELAATLEQAVREHAGDPAGTARAAARSVSSSSWEAAVQRVGETVTRETGAGRG